MRKMTHCAGCRQHFFASEARCPHCGASAPAGPFTRMARSMRAGGLMVFTALTTTACYGVPSPGMLDAPLPGQPGYEQPLPQVPSSRNRAHVFVTPRGGVKSAQTAHSVWARIEGNKLQLTSERGAGYGFDVMIEAPDASAFASAPGVREPLTVQQMTALSAEVSYYDVAGLASSAPEPDPARYKSITLRLPAATAAQGNLQLSRVDDETVGGVLRAEIDGTLIEIYFLAGRS